MAEYKEKQLAFEAKAKEQAKALSKMSARNFMISLKCVVAGDNGVVCILTASFILIAL